MALPLLRGQLAPATTELLTEWAASTSRRSELDEAAIEELPTFARRTDAKITFIEDARLLAAARYVGAKLRYRV